MPKRWRIVQSESFTWEYYDEETGEVLDRSGRAWDRRRDVRHRIREMKDSEVDESEEEEEA